MIFSRLGGWAAAALGVLSVIFAAYVKGRRSAKDAIKRKQIKEYIDVQKRVRQKVADAEKLPLPDALDRLRELGRLRD
ncbi:MAG: hypothetical protein AAF565_09560 [Pseudomonadota bacterium]